MRREWPDDGVPMRVTSVSPDADGEFWAEVEDEHGELFVRIKLMERPRVGAEWRLSLFDAEAVQ